MSVPGCPYCQEAQPPVEQFYETKLFRAMVARNALVKGHVVLMPKRHDPHFYSFTPDDIDEFGYLIKKVSFWSMRLTGAPGFTTLINDGTQEVLDYNHLQIHVFPRQLKDPNFADICQGLGQFATELDDAAVKQIVQELQRLMQLPQQ
jgi:diadenosine tetraphosphate (Ap4A) HIT family hydrolase